MGASDYNARANEITKTYYYTLMAHSWSRNKAYKVLRRNGSMQYYTYHLWER